MTSVTSPQQTSRGGADIPAPRDGQVVRLLVLGADADAQELRDQASAAGFELAQRYSARVSHVAYGSGVNPDDTKYHRLREAGLALLPVQACASQLGLRDGETGAKDAAGVKGPRNRKAAAGLAERAAGGFVLEAAAEVELGMVVARIEMGAGAAAGVVDAEAAAVDVATGAGEQLTDVEATADAEGFGDAGDVEVVEVVEVLDFPALDGDGFLEGSAAAGLGPRFDRFDDELGQSVGDAYAPLETLGELEPRVGAADDAQDVAVGDAALEDAAGVGAGDEEVAELPLAAAVIGIDPWTGDVGNGDERNGDARSGVAASAVRADMEADKGVVDGAVDEATEKAVDAGEKSAITATTTATTTATATTTTTMTTMTTTAPTDLEAADATDTEAVAAAEYAAQSADAAAGAPADAAAAPARVSAGYVLLSLAWALVPFVTFGLLTPVVFGYAAFRLRSRMLGVVALGYTVAVVLSFTLSAARPYGTSPTGAAGAVLTLALASAWIGGTVHALSLRVKVFAR
jgi:hypothetical protein